ncbi:WhiB family transcriptional regulator [Tessaracoccus rhinocerotis]|uniref:WhiB family transcriptional regulator n=1 Tax=Tessaracoccus rhinocerotis TaxID=1689449 RepID=UPI00163D9BCB|nr:WhiB family transcriptional regulator [Tessaracoccus rhinocerotis]
MTVDTNQQITACVEFSNIFLHPLLDESQGVSNQANRREQAMLRTQAEKMCAQCPLQAQCLTDAVTKFDVSGFVAGTTKRQRQEIRARLGVNLADDDFDSYAGVTSGRQFDRAEIHRLRMANPTEPLSAIAARVGCSVSTVKRHLRRIEREGLPTRTNESRTVTPEEVMAVAADVVNGTRRSAAA